MLCRRSASGAPVVLLARRRIESRVRSAAGRLRRLGPDHGYVCSGGFKKLGLAIHGLCGFFYGVIGFFSLLFMVGWGLVGIVGWLGLWGFIAWGFGGFFAFSPLLLKIGWG